MHTNNTTKIDALGDSFLEIYIQQAIDFANGKGKMDGVKFRAMTAAAGVVAKDKQTRGAMRALDFQIQRWSGEVKHVSAQ